MEPVRTVALLLAFLLGLLVGWLLFRRRARRSWRPSPPPPAPPIPKLPCPLVPDQLDAPALAIAIAGRLAGPPADGTRARDVASPPRVVWVEDGDEVVVHLDSTAVEFVDGETLLVSVDLESDQTGRQPLVVALVLGALDDPAGLLAVTDELPRGNALLASRWGASLQEAVFGGLIGLAADHAAERRGAPRGLSLDGGTLRLRAGDALTADVMTESA